MKGFLRTAAASVHVTVADTVKNESQIIRVCEEAQAEQVKLLVLPEMCVTGYTCQDLFRQTSLICGSDTALKEILEATQAMDMLIVLGHPFRESGKLYNVISFIYRGRILAVVPKIYIPNYSEFYELRYFTPGSYSVRYVEYLGQEVPFGANILIKCDNVPGLMIAGEICEDLWAPCPPSTSHALHGATISVNASASNETIAKADYRRGLVNYQAARTLSAYVYASAGDGESTQDLVFSAHHIISENGSILAESERFKDSMVIADIDIEKLAAERLRMNTFIPEMSDYVTVSMCFENPCGKFTRTFARHPFVPEAAGERESRCSEIITMQAFALKKRLAHIGCRRAVVGVSGGLDSTLALLVTVKAFDMLGLERSGVIGVTMPCFGTSVRTLTNAKKLMEALSISVKEVPIEEAVLIHLRDIGHDPALRDVTYENAQARERTQVLMDIANEENGIVVGTGDMTELALGWCTYNGDHMAMYGVNAGVPKTLVRHLVRYFADTDESVSDVLYDILDTPISPELLPPDEAGEITQKTEERIGPYELHDFFLYYMMRFCMRPERIFRMASIAFHGIYDEETILKWLKVFYSRFFSQQFKRSCLPDGPKIGSVSLSPRGDLRMPSDASFRLWLRELEDL